MVDTTAFRRRLQRIPARVRAEVVAVMQDAAEEVAGIMRKVGPNDRTFALERSIRVEPYASAMKVRILAGGRLTTKSVRKGASATYDYALAQEFGTQEMAANPFFYPTWRLRRRSVRTKINRAIRKAVRAEAARQGFVDG